jgi:hypothetical protein
MRRALERREMVDESHLEREIQAELAPEVLTAKFRRQAVAYWQKHLPQRSRELEQLCEFEKTMDQISANAASWVIEAMRLNSGEKMSAPERNGLFRELKIAAVDQFLQPEPEAEES